MSVSTEIIEALKASPLFKSFTDTGLQIIGSIAQKKQLPRGTPLFVEQMVGDAMYVVASGSLRISMRTPDGKELPLGVIRAPHSLGEAALLRTGPRLCSAYAEEPATVLEITRRDLAVLQRSKPQACLKLMMGIVELIGTRVQDTEADLREYVLWRTG